MSLYRDIFYSLILETHLHITFHFPQENIREEVSVDWWVVPLFVIDQEGDSVNDLTSGDIQLEVNGQRVIDFSLYKRSFNVAEKVMQKKLSPRVEKRKMIFFLFDLPFPVWKIWKGLKKWPQILSGMPLTPACFPFSPSIPLPA
jgi:hypothetical protein